MNKFTTFSLPRHDSALKASPMEFGNSIVVNLTSSTITTSSFDTTFRHFVECIAPIYAYSNLFKPTYSSIYTLG